MKKKIVYAFSFFLICQSIAFQSYSQSLSPSVIAASGGYASTGGVSLSWTLGETATATLTSGSNTLTQGFQQPYIELKVLNVKAFLEGYYTGSGMMQPVMMNQMVSGATSAQTDTLRVEMRSSVDPNIIVDQDAAVLSTDGNVSFKFYSVNAGIPYWLVLKHRNTIQTWSANPITLTSGVNAYNFTNVVTKAYADNMKDPLSEGIWSLYSGDINQDDFIDIFDFPDYDTDNQNFVQFQYVATDVNGDGFVDIFDFPVIDENNQGFVMALHP